MGGSSTKFLFQSPTTLFSPVNNPGQHDSFPAADTHQPTAQALEQALLIVSSNSPLKPPINTLQRSPSLRLSLLSRLLNQCNPQRVSLRPERVQSPRNSATQAGGLDLGPLVHKSLQSGRDVGLECVVDVSDDGRRLGGVEWCGGFGCGDCGVDVVFEAAGSGLDWEGGEEAAVVLEDRGH